MALFKIKIYKPLVPSYDSYNVQSNQSLCGQPDTSITAISFNASDSFFPQSYRLGRNYAGNDAQTIVITNFEDESTLVDENNNVIILNTSAVSTIQDDNNNDITFPYSITLTSQNEQLLNITVSNAGNNVECTDSPGTTTYRSRKITYYIIDNLGVQGPNSTALIRNKYTFN